MKKSFCFTECHFALGAESILKFFAIQSDILSWTQTHQALTGLSSLNGQFEKKFKRGWRTQALAYEKQGRATIACSSLNSEAIDMWKVTRHPQSRHVVACNDNLFWNITVFFLLEWDVRTIIKSKLKQVSKEF